jgi:hypothetical protein
MEVWNAEFSTHQCSLEAALGPRCSRCHLPKGRRPLHTDLWGGSRLDTHTAIVTNGLIHDQLLDALSKTRPEAPITPDPER